MKYSFSYILLSLVLGKLAHAATLGTEELYKMRIGQAKPIAIMGLVPVFKDSPSFRYQCVLDNDLTYSPDQFSAELLVDFAPIAPSGVVSFYYDQGKGDDFDLSITKSIDEPPKALPPEEIETAKRSSDSLTCVKGEDYTCKSLQVGWERHYDGVQLGEKWAGFELWGKDWFEPGLDIEESMEFYVFKRDRLYMTYSIEFTARQVGRMNQNIGNKRYKKNYVCELTPTDENVPRSGTSGTIGLPQPDR